MNENLAKIAVPGTVLAASLFALYLAIYRPSSLYRLDVLSVVVFLQLVVLTLWRFKERYFPFLLLAFIWAGTAVPLAGDWSRGRWAVLAVGAVAGLLIYTRDHVHRFGILHLAGLFAVIAAMVSALVSSHPEVAALKAGSLFLLFLYASTGGRLAVISRELKFFSGLLLGCEILVYIAAVCQLVLRFALFGNPNSLGAVMGVVVVPLLTWGVVVTHPTTLRRRRGFALILGIMLLFSSYSRASIGAAAISCVLLCVGLRRYKFLTLGLGISAICIMGALAFTPPRASESNSVISTFIFKGDEDAGAFASRRSVWQQTFSSIRQHPWFGTGFGTSATNYDSAQTGIFASNSATTREHGNSYLAISEWVGLLGVLPFLLMVTLIAINVGRVVVWMRKSGDPYVSVVPMAAVLGAGLFHAAFEDWMFAVGYYLCVFFWILAFAMSDVLPALSPGSEPVVVSPPARAWAEGFGATSSR